LAVILLDKAKKHKNIVMQIIIMNTLSSIFVTSSMVESVPPLDAFGFILNERHELVLRISISSLLNFGLLVS